MSDIEQRFKDKLPAEAIVVTKKSGTQHKEIHESWSGFGGLTVTRRLGEGVRLTIAGEQVDVVFTKRKGEEIRLTCIAKRDVKIDRFTIDNYTEIAR